jgi:hypothetical protein
MAGVGSKLAFCACKKSASPKEKIECQLKENQNKFQASTKQKRPNRATSRRRLSRSINLPWAMGTAMMDREICHTARRAPVDSIFLRAILAQLHDNVGRFFPGLSLNDIGNE